MAANNLPNQAICKKCRGEMKIVADIPAMGHDHGLVAFLCLDCGFTDTILVDRKAGKPDESGPDKATQ
jgi:hypothetical protein